MSEDLTAQLGYATKTCQLEARHGWLRLSLVTVIDLFALFAPILRASQTSHALIYLILTIFATFLTIFFLISEVCDNRGSIDRLARIQAKIDRRRYD